MDQAALGLMLQHLREKRGLKLRELAQLANVDHAYIYRLETGAKERPSDEVLSKLIRGVRAGNREAAMLRYLAEHTKTEPAVPSINSSCMRLANFLQPGCFGRLHVGRFKSRRRLYSGVEV